MEQTGNICSDSLTTPKEFESQIVPVNETTMILKEEDIANVIQDSNER